MRIEKDGWLFQAGVALILSAVVACGGGGDGGVGGTQPLSIDRDGDGVPNDQDSDPDDATVFSRFEDPVMLSNPAGGNFSTAVAVNAVGFVVGMADTPLNTLKAAIWEVDGAAQRSALVLDPLDDHYSAAYAINEAGLVAGESSDGAHLVPVIWSPGQTTPTALPLLTGGGTNGAAYGVNAIGQVVGEAQDATTGNRVAVFWAGSGASPAPLSGLGGVASAAYFISDIGEAAGEAEDAFGVKHAVIWDVASDTIFALPMLHADDSGAMALSINTAGQVVGELELADGSRTAVLWQPDSSGTYTAVNLGGTSAAAINVANRIAGHDTDMAVVWDARSTTVGTNNLVTSGLALSHAYGLNDAHAVGQVTLVVGIQDDRAFAAAAQ